MIKWIFLLFVFFLPSQVLFALDISVTERELGFNFRAEYNRVFSLCQDYAIFGGIELNNRHALRTGAALGMIEDEFDLKAFGSGRFAPFTGIPFNINLTYFYNGLPGYEIHSHSFLPHISYDGGRAGIALGTHLRLTSFFGEAPIFESILAFSVYFNFVNNDRLLVGIRCANFNDFYAGNFGSYSLNLNGAFRLNCNLTLVSELELLQSGGDGLANTFYGLVFMGGLRYKW